jgi:L-ascorbate metabolism protein UlaG (beta-lactamase superfamily)
MSPHHLSPEEAVHAHQVLNAATRAGIHFGTFRLGNDGQEKRVADLRKVVHRAIIPARRFWILDFGEGRDVSDREVR